MRIVGSLCRAAIDDTQFRQTCALRAQIMHYWLTRQTVVLTNLRSTYCTRRGTYGRMDVHSDLVRLFIIDCCGSMLAACSEVTAALCHLDPRPSMDFIEPI
jgi:hypothetical protein